MDGSGGKAQAWMSVSKSMLSCSSINGKATNLDDNSSGNFGAASALSFAQPPFDVDSGLTLGGKMVSMPFTAARVARWLNAPWHLVAVSSTSHCNSCRSHAADCSISFFINPVTS
ncbi:hypothetical protein MA12_gp10 [Pectobacterium phage MA12]|uniref:Uncharacterized protein n=1 Tax=Pectobacterium phage MA12 TaxID=2686474 RepID=A0A6B9RJS8_9CAUD|nr:hypothetical protein JT357_gp10 [Pectobacterium phage MA12]QHI00837.1 hypothetical protein MA12_gp10 [Pectobacterium phage MA12]